MIDSDDYDCIRCGACCTSSFEADEYVHMRQEDVARLAPEEQKALVNQTNNPIVGAQFAMKTAVVRGDCRCVALQGKVGEQVSCTIYDRRPSACRQFTAGSFICDAARQSVLGISTK